MTVCGSCSENSLRGLTPISRRLWLIERAVKKKTLTIMVGFRYSRIPIWTEPHQKPSAILGDPAYSFSARRGNLHGYGIIQEVARNSDGHYRLGPGTLYDN